MILLVKNSVLLPMPSPLQNVTKTDKKCKPTMIMSYHKLEQ